MNQAITVHILPATNTKLKRWKAKCLGGSIIVSDESLWRLSPDEDKKAQVTAEKLCDFLRWPRRETMSAGMIYGDKWVFTFDPVEIINKPYRYARALPFTLWQMYVFYPGCEHSNVNECLDRHTILNVRFFKKLRD